MAVDPSFEFEKRRNVPVKYNRELWTQSISAMQARFYSSDGWIGGLIDGLITIYILFIDATIDWWSGSKWLAKIMENSSVSDPDPFG